MEMNIFKIQSNLSFFLLFLLFSSFYTTQATETTPNPQSPQNGEESTPNFAHSPFSAALPNKAPIFDPSADNNEEQEQSSPFGYPQQQQQGLTYPQQGLNQPFSSVYNNQPFSSVNQQPLNGLNQPFSSATNLPFATSNQNGLVGNTNFPFQQSGISNPNIPIPGLIFVMAFGLVALQGFLA